jgi:hypothetical protein
MTLDIPDDVAINFFKSTLSGIEMSGVYVTRCPVCGDSEKNTHKKRFYMIKRDSKWGVYCHNCAYASSLIRFVKEYYPSNYDYITNQCLNSFFKPKKFKKNIETTNTEDVLESLFKSLKDDRPQEIKKTPAELYIAKNSVKLLEDCGDSCMQREVNAVRETLFNRMLKKELIDSMYYSFNGTYKYRALIPFYDEQGKIFYFQAMATLDWQKKYKYLNFKDESITHKPIYNEFAVDRSKKVYLVEGLFDSTFVDNSVATIGVNFGNTVFNELKHKYQNRVWIMDNDSAGIKKTKELLNKGESCVIFPKKYKSVKDLNDLALLLNNANLTEIVEKCTYNNICGLIEINRS